MESFDLLKPASPPPSVLTNRLPLLDLETVCSITSGGRNLSKIRCFFKKKLSIFPAAIGKQILVCLKTLSLQMLFLTKEVYVVP